MSIFLYGSLTFNRIREVGWAVVIREFEHDTSNATAIYLAFPITAVSVKGKVAIAVVSVYI